MVSKCKRRDQAIAKLEVLMPLPREERGERIIIELMTSDYKLKATREGSNEGSTGLNGNDIRGFKGFYVKAKARIWP